MDKFLFSRTVIGTIVEVDGPVVKIACIVLPPLHQALQVSLGDDSYMLEVYQHIDQNPFSQDKNLCQGEYWSEDQASLIMKKWATEWKTKADWEKRGEVIRQGLIKGMKLDQMPKVDNNFNAIIHSTHNMDGYIVENIAIESFPGFYITGNLYRPAKVDKRCPASLIFFNCLHCTKDRTSNSLMFLMFNSEQM